MTAAQIVPYGSPNADLAAEVERLRQQIAQYEGAGGAYPDHQYDRHVNSAWVIRKPLPKLFLDVCQIRVLCQTF